MYLYVYVLLCGVGAQETIKAGDHFSLRQEYKGKRDSTMKRFELTRLPPYLIFYIKRFTKNLFFTEKNPTIVNFPVK